jgi:3-hydroxyacyl-CoA dehydrogenase/enoyl-CoA hydratase/3-hydroxybutyryl-CoA epimerase
MPDVPAFSVERDGRVAVVIFDLPGEPINMLTSEVGGALVGLLGELAGDATVDAIVLVSGKKDVFIAGADIEEFVALQSVEQARELSQTGQRWVDRIAASPKPIVMAIHGACLGGGLEVAMAAQYRVASDAPATQLGLPEVQLGILPAAGGCQRLPRLVGLRAALDMILTGKPVRPPRALRIGLVDELVPQAILRPVAVAAAGRLASGWTPDRTAGKGPLAVLLDRNPIGRALVFTQARTQVMKRTGGHYPAPLAAIDAIRHGLSRGMQAGLAREARHFGELAVGPVSRHLVQIFFATTALKKDAGADGGSARAIERLGVVGAGFMGAAIAGVAVLRAGVDVRLRDTDWTRVSRGVAAARKMLDEARARRRLDRHEHYRRLALISGAPDLSGFGRRDAVIEAVFEDVDVKRGTLGELEAVTGDECVLASNTSTIPIGRLQEGARRPERILGMHFFSPVDRMPLLEVIRGPATADWATATAVRFGQRMGKTVIVVKDAPGFWVNRILAPYLNEAGWLLEEGVPIETIDRALTDLGFPVGPLTLLDEVGLDVAGKGSAVLHEAFGDRLTPAPVLLNLMADGRLGRKSGRGFYRYERGKKRGPDPGARDSGLGTRSGNSDSRTPNPESRVPGPEDIQRRPFLAMLNEAARAMSEGVVRHPSHGDIGAVMGFGFPPFLGGPLRYIDDHGAAATVAELERYAASVGPRFAPADVLAEMARSGRRFYE